MIIEEKTVYICEGKIFHSRESVDLYEGDCIGVFIQKNLLHNIVFSPSDRIKLLQNVLEYRDEIIAILRKVNPTLQGISL